jgi:hypothetical protein
VWRVDDRFGRTRADRVGRAGEREVHTRPGTRETPTGRLLDLDVLTAPLTGVLAAILAVDDLDAAPLAHSRSARYATLQAVGVDNVRLGHAAVLVAPFSYERRDPLAWSHFTDPLAEVGGVPQLVWLRILGRCCWSA